MVAPLIMFLLTVALYISLKPLPREVGLVLGALLFLVVIAGLITAIIGLCGIQEYGTQKLLGRSIAGLLMNGLLLGLFALGFVAGFKKAVAGHQDLEQVQSDSREMQAKLKASYNDKTGITNFDVNSLSKMQGDLDRASQTLTGDDAAISQAMSQYLSRMRAGTESYTIEIAKLRAANILAFSNVTSRADLATSRRLVEHFMQANQNFEMTISNSEPSIRADLQALKVPPEKIETVISGFDLKFIPRYDLDMRIRECDNDMGQSMLDILDRLDSIWGQWHYDPMDHKILFYHHADLEIYNDALANIHSAARRQLVFQKQLVNLR